MNLKPPSVMMDQINRMPKASYSLICVVNGKVENAEYCVWDRDGHREELWKFKKKVIQHNLNNQNIQYWVKEGKDIYLVDMLSPTIDRIPGT
jgi:hypothetical protein